MWGLDLSLYRGQKVLDKSLTESHLKLERIPLLEDLEIEYVGVRDSFKPEFRVLVAW